MIIEDAIYSLNLSCFFSWTLTLRNFTNRDESRRTDYPSSENNVFSKVDDGTL